MTNAPEVTSLSLPLTDDAVHRLVDAFDAATLPQSEWTHAAHITVAAVQLFRDPEHALDALRAGIRRLNAAHGLVESPTRGYHETLTRFYTRAVAREMRAAPAGLGVGALATRAVVALTDRDIPLDHYSRERLMSPAARAGWVEPDLVPLAQDRAPSPRMGPRLKPPDRGPGIDGTPCRPPRSQPPPSSD